MTNKKNIMLSGILLSAVMLLSACGSSAKAETPAETPTDANVQSPGETSEESGNMTITHELGEVTLEKNPETVVVFDYGLLDIMDNLGIEVSGLPMGNIPSFLEKYNDEAVYKNVGTLKEPDFEAVFEMEPDVIFISGRTAAAYEELSKIAPTVYLTVDNADYMSSVEANAELIGELFGEKDKASEKFSELTGKVENIKAEVAKLDENALIILANDGSLSSYGSVSRFGILHNTLGFKEADENIEDSTHGQSVTYEYILEKNPENLFIIDRAAVVGGETIASSTMDNDIIKETEAFKNNKIHYLNPEVWYITSGGFTGTGMMLDEVEKVLGK
ncbi:siderophore ABC transporter substrate-binding protein [Proteiniclasticum sp.]|uniref:siderophore ABC transporter substrate-binding protein n=1 Tax=Proteiniclasticum sp. TaxID=2053595 RepID=UPI0028996ABA|nr:siderophore ABC transporter substrate-binding protein [Proteiniclasticum sp.]